MEGWVQFSSSKEATLASCWLRDEFFSWCRVAANLLGWGPKHNLQGSCSIKKPRDEVMVLAPYLAKAAKSYRLLKRPAECLPHLITARDSVIINCAYNLCACHFFFASSSLPLTHWSLFSLSSQAKGVVFRSWCSSKWDKAGVWLQAWLYGHLLLWGWIRVTGTATLMATRMGVRGCVVWCLVGWIELIYWLTESLVSSVFVKVMR